MLKPRLTKYMVMMLVLMLTISNVGLAAAAEKELSKIVVSKNEMSLEVGDSGSVTVTGVYSDNTSANVTISSSWTSSDTSVATAYNGSITAKKEGTATITVAYQGQTQPVQIKVTKKVKALSKSVQNLELRTGESKDIVLTATYSDNTTNSDAASSAEWSTSNEKVATVVNGKVTGQSAGTAVITAKLGSQSVTLDVSVEVVKRVDVDKKQVNLLLNKSEVVKLTATYPDGTTKDVTDLAEWTSSNEKVADVLKGNITGYSAGSAVITGKYGTKSVSVDVDVDQTSKLSVEKQSIFFRLSESNKTANVVVTASYPNSSDVNVTDQATWTSSNEKVATVFKGQITAVSAGSTTIKATYSGKTVEVAVDVDTARYLDIKDVNDKLAMSVTGDNRTKKLTANAEYIDASKEDVTSKATWTSSDAEIVYVSGGELIAYKSGTATITAAYGGKTVKFTVSVDVPDKYEMDKKKATVAVGGTTSAKVLALYGETSKDVSEDATWSSSSEKIAEVDSKGVITGVATGKATITAKIEGKTLTLPVEVGMASDLEADVNFVVLSAKETQTVILTGTDGDGNTKDVTADATWKSSNARVADVKKGVITGNSSGKANITAEYGSQKVTIQVEVDVISRITASEPALSLKSGDTVDLTVTATLSDGSERDITDKAEWKTNSYKVAQVTKGKVKALNSGKAKITAKYGGKTVTIALDVDTLKYLQTDKVTLTMKAGDKATVVATATYVDGSEANVSKPALWTSSRIATASVKDGVIQANGKGKATITVSYAGVKTKVTVVVEAK
ncbi:Ig-like domain-containing protein [Paenibacillus silvae]|uniref:Ig-like domain-containing protein n=1 Tax=Paenibacillus silvae TaxID=1325358 RepID=UPI0020068B1E|nr:Ig-like domain-containing protein [Paenibacillus silvae]MCK6077048.1 Ig-like domain-containing protein [Paenibacillus silvae]MCK6151246.1 Ig-like domain-containing protein [Paenibacillus silvae]MCK6269734.1 Ig-like domain-containing protein [Paenibacillus silvae]